LYDGNENYNALIILNEEKKSQDKIEDKFEYNVQPNEEGKIKNIKRKLELFHFALMLSNGDFSEEFINEMNEVNYNFYDNIIMSFMRLVKCKHFLSYKGLV